jgi:hypothetical protein
MRNIILLFILMIGCMADDVYNQKNSPFVGLEKYIGVVYQASNNLLNIKEMGGMCIGDNCKFSFADVEITEKNKKIKAVFLQSEAGRSGQSAIWKVEDIIKLPPSIEKQKLELSFGNCISDKYQGSNIVAYGKWKLKKGRDGEWYVMDIKKAWVADLGIGKFVEIEPKNVKCEMDANVD